jgi:hypothetical protein
LSVQNGPGASSETELRHLATRGLGRETEVSVERVGSGGGDADRSVDAAALDPAVGEEAFAQSTTDLPGEVVPGLGPIDAVADQPAARRPTR